MPRSIAAARAHVRAAAEHRPAALVDVGLRLGLRRLRSRGHGLRGGRRRDDRHVGDRRLELPAREVRCQDEAAPDTEGERKRSSEDEEDTTRHRGSAPRAGFQCACPVGSADPSLQSLSRWRGAHLRTHRPVLGTEMTSRLAPTVLVGGPARRDLGGVRRHREAEADAEPDRRPDRRQDLLADVRLRDRLGDDRVPASQPRPRRASRSSTPTATSSASSRAAAPRAARRLRTPGTAATATAGSSTRARTGRASTSTASGGRS